VEFEEYDAPETRTENGVARMPGGGEAAWFKDSEGNLVGVAPACQQHHLPHRAARESLSGLSVDLAFKVAQPNPVHLGLPQRPGSEGNFAASSLATHFHAAPEREGVAAGAAIKRARTAACVQSLPAQLAVRAPAEPEQT